MRILIEVIGWFAGLLILVAYWLLSTGRLDGRSVPYQAMNIAGAAGFIVNSGWNGALPSATLNAIWLMIGIYTLWRKLAAH
jgi:hypothetical protein